jgi:hypothetical protein
VFRRRLAPSPPQAPSALPAEAVGPEVQTCRGRPTECTLRRPRKSSRFVASSAVLLPEMAPLRPGARWQVSAARTLCTCHPVAAVKSLIAAPSGRSSPPRPRAARIRRRGEPGQVAIPAHIAPRGGAHISKPSSANTPRSALQLHDKTLRERARRCASMSATTVGSPSVPKGPRGKKHSTDVIG